jgi:AAA domain, putative AbiEii toxin, Type IV TA system
MMNIYYRERRGSIPKDAEFPCLVLGGDSWNDYGYQTLFHALWCWSRTECIELGDTKILQRGNAVTEVKRHFHELSNHYCSLGQSFSYYEQIHELGRKISDPLLLALRDIVAHPHFAQAFQSDKGFQESLLRSSEAEKSFKEAGSILQDSPLTEKGEVKFTYTAKLKAASAPHQVQVRFGGSELLPNRIVAFIGKNATGKTWLLSRLASDISGDKRRIGKFKPDRPSFNRVIAISYSALDRFRRPPKGEKTFSYHYCGIYDNKGKVIPRTALLSRMSLSYDKLVEKERDKFWHELLSDVFDKPFADRCRRSFRSDEPSDDMKLLSSGQMILLLVFTEVLSAIERESLLLYDEPELHLHPNAISGLMQGITRVLNRFSSYAIVATHSPLIIQQIPSDYVRIFTRVNNQTFISILAVESFGENLSALTDEVFQVNASESIFQAWLRSVRGKASEDQILGVFTKPLSFNAKSLIRSFFEARTRGGEN